jgi:hypothetical protein
MVAPGKDAVIVSKFPWMDRWIAAEGSVAVLVNRFAEIVFFAAIVANGKLGVVTNRFVPMKLP